MSLFSRARARAVWSLRWSGDDSMKASGRVARATSMLSTRSMTARACAFAKALLKGTVLVIAFVARADAADALCTGYASTQLANSLWAFPVH